jgi:hypothetical protein
LGWVRDPVIIRVRDIGAVGRSFVRGRRSQGAEAIGRGAAKPDVFGLEIVDGDWWFGLLDSGEVDLGLLEESVALVETWPG